MIVRRVRSLAALAYPTVSRALGLVALGRFRHRDDCLVLAYHNIVPDGYDVVGDRSLHMPLTRFLRQVDEIRRTHVVIGPNQLFDPTIGHRPRAMVTFDDAYRGAVVLAIPELAKRGVPATIFVAPAWLGAGPFWWDTLAASCEGGLEPGQRHYALNNLSGRDDQVRAWAIGRGMSLREVGQYERAASESEVLEAATTSPLTIGSHSWSHPNLARISNDEARLELSRSLSWLRERFSNVVPWIAYPYGSMTEATQSLASEVGYTAGWMVDRGWVDHRATNRFRLPRVNVPAGASPSRLSVIAAGLP